MKKGTVTFLRILKKGDCPFFLSAKLGRRKRRKAHRGHSIALDFQALTDARLVTHARAGAEPAFREIVRRYERPVMSLLARMVNDPALAEDLAQETFLKAYRRLSTFDTGRRFSSWLFRIAHNTAVDALRRRGPVEVEQDREPAVPPQPDPVETADLGRALDAALASLRPEHRMAILLRYQQGFSYEEIGDAMEIPEGTAKTFVHRARKLMAEALEKAGWKPE
jgi:RNA polymerase sigma-70 factor (ECF subfamily)